MRTPPCAGHDTAAGLDTNSTLFIEEQVKPGFTNYQPRGLANQIKFER